jgi:Tfp pilus assembly protein FimT
MKNSMWRNVWKNNEDGFTVVELLVIMGIATLLFLLISMNLLDARTGTAITTTTDTLISDLKLQQTKAMLGDTEGRGIPDAYGVYIANNKYVLFHGTTYVPSDPTNFTINAEAVAFSTTFPNAVVVFATKSGEIINYSSANNHITVKDANTTTQKVLQLNKLGTATALQ